MTTIHPVEMLLEDHRKIRQLIHAYRTTNPLDVETRRNIAESILEEVSDHCELEEKFIYPALEKETGITKDIAFDSLYDHREIRSIIGDIKTLNPKGVTCQIKFEKLVKAVDRHFLEEERLIFPVIREKLTDMISASTGIRMAALRNKQKAGLHSHSKPW